jgi:D-alanyl-D-alanine dipeptidase
MTQFASIPLNSPPDVGGAQIIECGEAIARLEAKGMIFAYPAYYNLGYRTATNLIRLRTGVIEALQHAARRLPAGVSFIVWDGLRTVETQREIAERFEKTLSLSVANPCDRAKLVRKFVAPLPNSEAEYRKCPPPHTTGGAVDLTLGDDAGVPLDLGAEFDQFDESAAVNYYEKEAQQGGLSPLDQRRSELRRLLYWSMVGTGFAPYPFEYWHFEYRTRNAATFFGHATADYGPVVPLKEAR